MSKITDVVMVVWGVMKVGCDVVTVPWSRVGRLVGAFYL